jgi:hypothetical protein
MGNIIIVNNDSTTTRITISFDSNYFTAQQPEQSNRSRNNIATTLATTANTFCAPQIDCHGLT